MPTAIVLGAGHNGLVAAFYLARAGHEVHVLERRDLVGGACITEEVFPGIRASTCAYLCHLLQDRVADDMDLAGHGLRIHALDPMRFTPLPGGHRILGWRDAARTAEEIARIHAPDGARYADWLSFWERSARILNRHFLSEPPTLAQLAREVSAEEAPLLERMVTGSMLDLVEEHFEHPLVRAAFAEAQDAGDVRAPGSVLALAFMKCGAFCDPSRFGIPQGGMGAITQAMARAATAAGFHIRTDCAVERILVRGGRAVGVRLAGGDEVDADVVVSNADPKRTFLGLLDPADLPPGFAARVGRLRTEVGYLKLHCALSGLPDFSAWLGSDVDPRCLAYTRLCPSVDYYEQSWRDARAGRPSSCPVMLVQIPTLHDDSLAPAGVHVMSVWVQYAPVHPREGTWDDLRGPVGEALLGHLSSWIPNLRAILTAWDLSTPVDIQRRVGLTDGNIRHLDMQAGQMLGGRHGYRTPVAGLYLCGGGTHPGGEVTGAPGHNAAHAVLRDLGA